MGDRLLFIVFQKHHKITYTFDVFFKKRRCFLYNLQLNACIMFYIFYILLYMYNVQYIIYDFRKKIAI